MERLEKKEWKASAQGKGMELSTAPIRFQRVKRIPPLVFLIALIEPGVKSDVDFEMIMLIRSCGC